ncbi:aldo/keto reductase [Jiangella muralis]|uniref:aldo/keto reductase n=1 Tax=Jiangella muralis TaxID=702383 RepID=UPI00069E5251|nr:aldo/keto reductase [Jiangella muralis]
MTTGDAPVLALGCAPLARVAQVDDQTAVGTVHAALAEGMTLLDTAPHYGAGVSERRVGDALRGVPRDGYRVSTKVGRSIEPPPGPGERFTAADGRRSVLDDSYDGAWRSLEGSLRRLGVDHVDVLHAHDPIDPPRALRGLFRALTEMREQGLARTIGCGMNRWDLLLTYLDEVPLDCVMVAGHLNLLDQGLADTLLPLARERGVDVWVAGVYATGVLAAPGPASTYRYEPATASVLERVAAIDAICRRHDVGLRAAAVRFPWRYAGVTQLVVGAREPAEVRQAAEAARVAVPDAVWDELSRAELVPARSTG